MKFRPTKLLTTVRPFAASNNTRSAAKSHFAFQPASEFAKTATARASRVAVTLRGGGLSGSILTPSGKLVAMRLKSRSAPRFGDQLPLSVRSQPQRRERSTAQHLGLSSAGGRRPRPLPYVLCPLRSRRPPPSRRSAPQPNPAWRQRDQRSPGLL